jgi:hypothetical protein
MAEPKSVPVAPDMEHLNRCACTDVARRAQPVDLKRLAPKDASAVLVALMNAWLDGVRYGVTYPQIASRVTDWKSYASEHRV